MNLTEIQKNFVETINHIVNKPAIFSVNRVEDISLIIYGITIGSSGNEKQHNELRGLLDAFRDFANKEFGTDIDHNWSRLIRFYSASDSHSIEYFGKIFNKFLDEFAMSN